MTDTNYGVPKNTKISNDKLLKIIHKGIDDIIVNLKRAVDEKGDASDGDVGTIDRTNASVDKILNVFEEFKKGILPDKSNMKDEDGNTDLLPDTYKDTNVDENGNLIETGLLYDNMKVAETKELPNNKGYLDKATNIKWTDYSENKGKKLLTFEEGSGDLDTLNQRLTNCTNLEIKYLKKHEEIIKIFAFVLTLFDKYKYAIKVILFLLKNLVRGPEGFTVNLPKPLIKNIDLLLKDQTNIQTIVDGMKKVVDETHTVLKLDNPDDIVPSLENKESPPLYNKTN